MAWQKLRGRGPANLSQQALAKHLKARGIPVEAQVFRGIPTALEDNASRIRKRERRAAITINFCWEDETLLYTFLQNPPKKLVEDNEEKRVLLRCAACTDSSCYFMVADPRDDYNLLWWKWPLSVSCLCELTEG
ncbi:MAG: hypothetical protein RMK98_04395 [Bacteroidia bacterium]|nr:hypothetical protein [Bacteroidia bacterium]